MIAGKKVAGIIAEYNPFHTGHRYHIEQTRLQTGADYIVVVMSGNYVQRGEPAIVNKYFRTNAALENGADLVIEIPMIYATGSAQFFARAGVQILNMLGCVDYISFGSESASVEELEQIADIIYEEPASYQDQLKMYLASGYNYPKARAMALEEVLKRLQISPDVLAGPNHILGLEYLQALKWSQSSIRPVAVARKASHYHDQQLGTGFPSATALRSAFSDPMVSEEEIKKALGISAEGILEAWQKGESVNWSDLLIYLNYNYIYNHKYVEKYYGMNIELKNRMEHNYRIGMDFDSMIRILHSKNMTDTAIKRGLLHIVTKTEEAPYLIDSNDIYTPYIRVLGMRKESGALLKMIRKMHPDTVIQKPVDGIRVFHKDPRAQWIYQEDLMASDLYEQICAMKNHRPMIRELERQQIIL